MLKDSRPETTTGHKKIRCTDCEDIKAQGFLSLGSLSRGTTSSWKKLILAQNLRAKLFLNTAKLQRWHNSQLSTWTKYLCTMWTAGNLVYKCVWGSCWGGWYGVLSSESSCETQPFLCESWDIWNPWSLRDTRYQCGSWGLYVWVRRVWPDSTSCRISQALFQCIWKTWTGRRRRMTLITLCDVLSLDWGCILTSEYMVWFWACSWLW